MFRHPSDRSRFSRVLTRWGFDRRSIINGTASTVIGGVLLGCFTLLPTADEPPAETVSAVTDEVQAGEGIDFGLIPEPDTSEDFSFVRHSLFGFDRD